MLTPLRHFGHLIFRILDARRERRNQVQRLIRQR
jgi:hypothetical protein